MNNITLINGIALLGLACLAGCASEKATGSAASSDDYDVDTCGCYSRYEAAIKAAPGFAVGQSIYQVQKITTKDPATGKDDTKTINANEETSQKMAHDAVADAMSGLGVNQAKFIWVFDRTNLHANIDAGLKEALGGQKIPYLIEGSYWHEYGSLSNKAVSDQNQQSVAAMAFGGNIGIQVATLDIAPMDVKEWDLNKKYGNEEGAKIRDAEQKKHQAWGVALAKKFDFNKSGSKVLLVGGSMHTPRHQWVLEGINTVIPKDVHVVGGTQADFGWIVDNGKFKENTIYGILLSGDFKVTQVMKASDRNINDRAKELAPLLQQAKQNLGAKPQVAFYFGCAAWNRNQADQHKVIEQELPGVPIFGRFNGGEIGRFTNEGENSAGVGLASVLLIGK